MTTIIETEGLSKWYGPVLGVTDLKILVEPGITGLLGPNGAGKSTFLKLVAGQLKPSAGRVSVFGENPWTTPELYRKIGYCPEAQGLYTDLTARESLLFLLRLHGYREAEVESRTLQALEAVGLVDRADRRVETYSFGMKQRLKIALALAHDPDLLLFDEPLNGVDPLWRIRLTALFESLASRGKTLLVSSHILPEVEAMTRQILLIHQGKVFAQGEIPAIRELIDTHPHRVSLRVDRPREMAKLLLESSSLEGLQFQPQQEELLNLTVTNREKFYAFLLEVVVRHGFNVEEMVSTDDNLQSVFDYLVERKR